MTNKRRIAPGSLNDIPASRTPNYNFWTVQQQGPMYHGGNGYTYGVDPSNPLLATIGTYHYSDGLRCGLVQSPYSGFSFRHNNADFHQCSKFQAPVDAGLSGQVTISDADTTYELTVSGQGAAHFGDYNLDGGYHHRDRLNSYTTRYRLSAGLSLSAAQNVLLNLDNLSEYFDTTEVVLGDENGLPYPTYRPTIESALVPCTIGPDNPVYVYTGSDTRSLPGDSETSNTKESECRLMVRSDTTPGSTVIADSSPDARTLTASGVSHSDDQVLFGATAINMEDRESSITVDNTDDGLAARRDFTIRCALKAAVMSTTQRYRLFHFDDDNYLDLSGTCEVEGRICSVDIKGYSTDGDWKEWTTLSVIRSGRNIYVSINGKCVAHAESDHMFGGSFLYSAALEGDGLGFTDMEIPSGYRTIDQVFHNVSDYWTYMTDESYYGPLTFGYDFGFDGEKVVKAYAFARSGTGYDVNFTATAWLFQGSHDKINWDTLDRRQGEDIRETGWHTFTCETNSTAYRYYQVVVLSVYDKGNRLCLGYFDMYAEASVDEADTMTIGTNDTATAWSFIGYIEDFQFAHSALKDPFGRLNNGASYTHPGLPDVSAPEFSPQDRLGYKTDTELYSIISLTKATLTGSAELDGYEVTNLVDDDTASYWDPNATVANVQVDSTVRFSRACQYKMTIPVGSQANAPTAWTLEGYDGSSWHLLDQRTGVTAWLDGEEKLFCFKRPDTSYESYKMSISAVDGGTTIHLAEFELSDKSRYTLDQEYAPVVKRVPGAASVRSGEVHISANDRWTVNGDESTLSSDGFLLELRRGDADQILVDNSGRPASANQLVRVDGLSWSTPAKLTVGGIEVLYRFMSSGYLTSETVDSTVLIRMDLPGDEITIIDVDTVTAPSAFLAESEVLIDSSDDGDSSPYTKLNSSVDNMTLDSIGLDLLDGDLLNPGISTPNTAGYRTWETLGALPVPTNTFYNSQIDNDGVYSAKGGGYALFEGQKDATQSQRTGAITYLYSSFSNTFWRVADRPVYVPSDADFSAHAAMTYEDGLFWSYGGRFRLNTTTDIAYRSWLHSYDTTVNLWNTDLADGPLAIWKHSMSAHNSVLYSMCGHNGSASTDAIYAYDIATNVWTTNTSPAVNSNYLIRTTDWNGHIMTLGGEEPSVADQCDLNDFDTSTGTDVSINTDCPCGFRSGFDASRLENLWYLTGNGSSSDMRDTWYCDLTTNTFVRTLDELVDNNRWPAFEVFDRYALNVRGGTQYVRSFARVQSEFARFDERAELSEIGYRASYTVNAGVTTGDKPYAWVSGGGSAGSGTATTQLYDISENQWIPLPDCPTSHIQAAGGVYDDAAPKGVVWHSNAMYEYDVETRAWTNPAVTDGSNQLATHDFASTIHDGKMYMYGGNSGGSPTDKLFVLDLAARSMSELTLSGTVPPATMGGGLVFAEYDGGKGESLLFFKGTDGTGAFFTGDVALQTDVLALSGNDSVEHGSNVVRVEEFEGDFKLDLAISDMSTMTTSGDKLLMEVISDPDNRVNVGIDGTNWVYWDGTSTVTAARTNNYGSVRIQRTGSTIEYSYLDGPGSWTSMGTSTMTGLDVKLVIQGIFDSATKYVNLDSFTVDEVLEDDFSGTGDPSSAWAVNVDVYGQLNRIADIYSIDPSTGVCSASTPASGPQGEITSLSYYDREVSGGRTRVLAIDVLNDIHELNADTLEWSVVEFYSAPPRMGTGHLFSVCFEHDTYTRPVFVLGQGDIGDAQTALARVAHQEWELDVSLTAPATPEYLSIRYEPIDHTSEKMDLEVTGYDGSNWLKLADIPAAVVARTGRAYKLNNSSSLTALKIRGRYGLGTHTAPVRINGVSLLNGVRFGRATADEVELYRSEAEVLCPVASDGFPETSFASLGAQTTTSQTYVAKEIDRTGLYKTAADPGAYPYSAYYTTDDNTRATLSLTQLDAVTSLSLGNVKLAFSFDGRTSWVTYSGGWTALDISDEAAFRTSGIVCSSIGDIPLSAWTPYLSSPIDMAVLLTLDSASDYAYFSTVAFVGPDDEDGIRIMSPTNNWVCHLLDANSALKMRTFTDVAGSTPTEIFGRYDWSTGTHPLSNSAETAGDLGVHEIALDEDCEYIWATARPDGGRLPHMPQSGSFLRTNAAFDFFDYATGVRTRIEGNTLTEDISEHLRRAFGTSGIIRMTYSDTSASGYTEKIDSSTMTLDRDVAQTFDVIGGNGATLATTMYAWLTPGSLNSGLHSWYNSIVKVDYSNVQRYLNARCVLTGSFASGCGGVSDTENYGWLMGASVTAGQYAVLKLDYSNDTVGMTEPGSVDVSDLGATLYKSIGCSSPSKTTGYFWLKPHHTGGSNIHRMVKIRYSTDTSYDTFRTDASDSGSLSDAVNPQARSTGHTSLYFWTNHSDKTGPAELDLSTDTLSRRPSGGTTAEMTYGSQYCGSQASGLNY